MDNLLKNVTIDWDWVKSHVTSRERLKEISESQTKEAIFKQLKNALVAAKSKACPKVSLAKENIAVFNPTSIELKCGVVLTSKELSSHIKGATDIYVFLVTIGKDLEEAASSSMGSGDHLLGYLLDRIGSFAVESLAKNAEETLRTSLAKEHLSVSMRFSPGYCDWHIEEQFKLAKIIDFSKAGITLTKNCMMIPKKSISAIVGIGSEKLFAEVTSPCTLCNMKTCDYRRRT